MAIVYLPSLIQVIFSIGIIYYVYKQHKVIRPRIISLKDLKVKNYIKTICIITLCTTTLLLTIFVFKILNIGKEVNLKVLLLMIKGLLLTTPIKSLLINSLFLLSLIILLVFLSSKIKSIIFYEFIKLHLYLVKYKGYKEIVHIIGIQKYFLTDLVRKLFKSRFDLLHPSKVISFIKHFYIVEQHLGLILILICIIYDITINNFILTKIYYIFPLCYLYHIWRLIVNFFISRASWIDKDIHIYLYKKPIVITQDTLMYEDGFEISLEDLQDIKEYMLENFTFNANNIKLIHEFYTKTLI